MSNLPHTETGVIKFVNNKGHYGYVACDSGIDYFFSTNKFDRWIQVDDKVVFTATENSKGLLAVNIRKLVSREEPDGSHTDP